MKPNTYSQPQPHGLFQGEHGPFVLVRKALRVYPQEVKLLLWVTTVQLSMRMSSILMNNFAQTAFLKRFGVEALPTMYVVEAMVTFLFATVVGVLMNRHRVIRVFTGLFLFFCLSAGIIRAIIPLGHVWIYPILFILKSQVVSLLPILYWDIQSDLFTTQQSKRLYTLITAGGVLGTTLGSFLSPKIAHWTGADNILIVFMAGMVFTALLNEWTERIVGVQIEPRKDRKRRTMGSFKQNFKSISDYVKQSTLLRYMIIIVAIPNIVLPIMDYQFNTTVDNYFATEQGTLHFFGIFRGISNAFMFILLLITGRLVARWGIPRSLLLHPFNYLLAFGCLLFRFDIFAGIYGRFSTETLRTVLNNPARAVLYNFFPEHMRSVIRVFLRGNLVRAADFVGSGFLMLIRGLMHPRFLSLIAAPLVLIWIFFNLRIKKYYASMVIQSLTDQQIDWRHLEQIDFKAWIIDKNTIATLFGGLKDRSADVALGCADILSRAAPAGWAEAVVEAAQDKSPQIQKKMLDYLGPEVSEGVRNRLAQMARKADPEGLAHLLSTLARVGPGSAMAIMEEMAYHTDPRVSSKALIGLYAGTGEKARSIYRERLKDLLKGDRNDLDLAIEIIAATGDPGHTELLLREAIQGDARRRVLALQGLSRSGCEDVVSLALKAIEDSDSAVRRAAARAMLTFGPSIPLLSWIHLLGDQDQVLREIATEGIRQKGDAITMDLLTYLPSPQRSIRNGILTLLDEMGAPREALSRFTLVEINRCYRCLIYAKTLVAHSSGQAVTLLVEHLIEKKDEIGEVILRVLGHLEFQDQMPILLKAIHSGQRRDVDNAVEVLASSLHGVIRSRLIPLLDGRPLNETVRVAYSIPDLKKNLENTMDEALMRLLDEEDPLTQTLCLYAIGEFNKEGLFKDTITKFIVAENPMVKNAALTIFPASNSQEYTLPAARLDLIDKIQSIKNVPLFAGLRLREMAAVAHAASIQNFAQGQIVVEEGTPGNALYIVVSGKVSAVKGRGTLQETVLGVFYENDFFGEMELIDQQPRSASIIADLEISLLRLDSDSFSKIMQEYPSVPLNICTVLCNRLRKLHHSMLW
jgi:hypothetical protein